MGVQVGPEYATQNTSYIERFNLTLRQRVSYLQRKTPAMAMELTQEALTWRFLFVALILVTR